MYVYADVVFVINLVMNATILWLTARVTGVPFVWWRLWCGAFSGAIYAVLVLVPWLPAAGWLIKVLLSLVMVGITFAPLNVRKFAVVLGAFYLSSFTLGGAALAIFYFAGIPRYITNGTVHLVHFGTATLLGAIATVLTVGWLTWRYLRPRLWQERFYVPLRIKVGDRQLETKALVDSGNRLTDPLSRLPVIVAEYAVVRELLPGEVMVSLDRTPVEEWVAALEQIPPSSWLSRFHLVPYRSLGRDRGLLVGFRPDRVEIYLTGGYTRSLDAIVGLYHRPLSVHGDYHALLHCELISSDTR